MRHITRVLWSAAAALAMTGCGTEITSAGSSTGTSPGTSTSPSSSAPTSAGPSVFPVTITRTGGIAGFQDVLVVAADGLVSVKSKGQAKRQCRLTPEAVKAVTTSATQVAWPRITPGSTSPSFPDDMVSMVQSRAGGPVRLEDAQIGAGGRVFQQLLDDLSTGGSASGMCTPV